MSIMNTSMPTGTILLWSTANIPNGFLRADGSLVSRTTYSELFKVIGTTYGAGDGSTTFAIPDLKNKSIWIPQSNQGYGNYNPGQLANIFGYLQVGVVSDPCNVMYGSGPFGADLVGNAIQHDHPNSGYNTRVIFSASSSSSIYSTSYQGVQPTSINVNAIIKY